VTEQCGQLRKLFDIGALYAGSAVKMGSCIMAGTCGQGNYCVKLLLYEWGRRCVSREAV